MNIGNIKHTKFSQVLDRANQLQGDFDQAKAGDFIVDYFDGGKGERSPGVAGYKAHERMKSLIARVGDKNPSIGELEIELDKKIAARQKAVGFAGLGLAVSLLGVAATGLLHMLGVVDAGTVGEFLSSSTPQVTMLSAGSGALISKTKDMFTKGLKEDKRFLGKMERLMDLEQKYGSEDFVSAVA